MLKFNSLFSTAVAFSALLVANQSTSQPAVDEPNVGSNAVVVLIPTAGNDVKGTILMEQKEGYVHVRGKVINLEPGEHGFHIHQYGDLRDPEGKSAGGHYNPEGHDHGGPDDEQRHAGDLGNITADESGVAMVDKKAQGLDLHFAIGRSIVVHAGEDDLKSQPSGDAGPRAAVGVIGIAQEE